MVTMGPGAFQKSVVARVQTTGGSARQDKGEGGNGKEWYEGEMWCGDGTP